jgi:predicted ATPase
VEILQCLVDSDNLVRVAEKWELHGEVETLPVPDTIHSVIMSRIDRLESGAKQTLQCASVIGDLFEPKLLKSLCDDTDLERHLAQLQNFDFISDSQKPNLEYSFKHALIRDVATSSLLPEKKREYHQKIGEAIERFYPDRIDEYYELLAHHYESSAKVQKALEYLIKAGDKSKALYANQQAIDYYTRAMALIKSLPEERIEQKSPQEIPL